MSLPARFWSKVDKSGECWIWTGGKTYDGYGVFDSVSNAHRLAYEELVGKIPEGYHIDHLCRNPSCVNPKHMEPVTPKENYLRGNGRPAQNARMKTCPKGHKFYLRSNGHRRCLPCFLEWQRNHRKKLKENKAQ